MTWLNIDEAIAQVTEGATACRNKSVGIHVFYSRKNDAFSVTKGCQNRGSIQDRIERSPSQYCGFYRGEVDQLSVANDLEFIQRQAQGR